jgi:hypothetical protein
LTSPLFDTADALTGVVDVTIRLTERKRGAWNISGPVGPMSFAGGFGASLSSRLAAYTVSVSLFAFGRPIWPVLALERPFSPGEGWKSGFKIAPQLGWRAGALGYAATQVEQRPLPLLAGDAEPELVVNVERASGDTVILCPPPKLRFERLRRATAVGLQLLRAATAL